MRPRNRQRNGSWVEPEQIQTHSATHSIIFTIDSAEYSGFKNFTDLAPPKTTGAVGFPWRQDQNPNTDTLQIGCEVAQGPRPVESGSIFKPLVCDIS
jgi:hypothetical protein